MPLKMCGLPLAAVTDLWLEHGLTVTLIMVGCARCTVHVDHIFYMSISLDWYE
jgi:hypothetical protein